MPAVCPPIDMIRETLKKLIAMCGLSRDSTGVVSILMLIIEVIHFMSVG